MGWGGGELSLSRTENAEAERKGWEQGENGVGCLFTVNKVCTQVLNCLGSDLAQTPLRTRNKTQRLPNTRKGS